MPPDRPRDAAREMQHQVAILGLSCLRTSSKRLVLGRKAAASNLKCELNLNDKAAWVVRASANVLTDRGLVAGVWLQALYKPLFLIPGGHVRARDRRWTRV